MLDRSFRGEFGDFFSFPPLIEVIGMRWVWHMETLAIHVDRLLCGEFVGSSSYSPYIKVSATSEIWCITREIYDLRLESIFSNMFNVHVDLSLKDSICVFTTHQFGEIHHDYFSPSTMPFQNFRCFLRGGYSSSMGLASSTTSNKSFVIGRIGFFFVVNTIDLLYFHHSSKWVQRCVFGYTDRDPSFAVVPRIERFRIFTTHYIHHTRLQPVSKCK